ncbi:hypothetical protein [Salinirarus marinus]|uniref:hypothetical protein n=1 Tax=Salinirarus marinus TaxID=3068310 RepID=UPI003C6BFA2D
MATETDVDPAQFEDLPNTDIEVDLHVHFGMAGSFPLRLADLFFASDGLHVVEYSYITPMFGLGMKKHHREADAMQDVYDVHGLDEVLLQGDSVVWLSYSNVDRVLVHRGGWAGRPKLTVYAADGTSYAFRLHGVDVVDELVADLEAVGEDHGFDVEAKSGVGFAPMENLRRLFG